MERRYRITVDGHPYTVTVEELGGTAAPHPADAPRSPRSEAPAQAPAPAPVAAAPVPAAAPGAVVSSLGGVVEKIHVAVGDAVAVGDTLITIEAMKMKNAIVAPSAGVVGTISVAVGETVDSGQILLTLA
ncbi:biotin/lipoyl-containing protein [Niveibacterium terrae]|uniref:biotin/lipoyl-containing protein n=1 Tax=Niveibacterium terrae TaxID=3373598 RepID=UPI003A950F81